jgi:hypothetical protein
VIAAAMMFSGAALLVHIASGVSLRLTLAVATTIVIGSIGGRYLRSSEGERTALRRGMRRGALGGLLATVCYDGTRALLSRLDSSPYNPFEVVRIFGQLLTSDHASPSATIAVGALFHLLNGVCFGVAFSLLFERPTILRGIAWGLVLEIVQLSIYPGWLNIRFFREFAQISFASHVAYGAVLGAWCARGSLALTEGDG